MRRMLLVALLLLAGCQSGPQITCGDNCSIDMGNTVQERGGNSPSTLNPPITADVDNSGDLSGLPGLP